MRLTSALMNEMRSMVAASCLMVRTPWVVVKTPSCSMLTVYLLALTFRATIESRDE